MLKPLNASNRLSFESNLWKAYLLFISSLFVSAINDLITKSLLETGINMWTILFGRLFFGFIILIPKQLLSKQLSLRTTNLSIHIFKGVLLLTALACWIKGINGAPLITISVLNLCFPLISLLIAPLFLYENTGRQLWIATFFAMIGAVILIAPKMVTTYKNLPFFFISLLLFVFQDLLHKKQIEGENINTVLFYTKGVATFLAFIPSLYFINVGISIYQILGLLLLGIGGDLILYLILLAYKNAPLSKLSHLRYLELIFSSLLGYYFFEEPPQINHFIGGAIIIVVAFLASKNDEI